MAEGRKNHTAYPISSEESQYAYPPAVVAPAVANPAPLGLMGFGITTFVLSCYNTGIFGVETTSPPNVVTGLALFYGGLAQGLAGMWEFKAGNTFGATVFTSYGAFWLSYAVILIPGFGVKSGYLNDGKALGPAVAIFLLGWTIFTFLMWLGTLRSTVGLTSLFFTLFLTFGLLTMSEYEAANGHNLHRAAGYMGVLTAIIAFYNALAALLTKENSYFTLPIGKLQ